MDVLSRVTSTLIAFSLLYPLPSMHEDQFVMVHTLAIDCELSHVFRIATMKDRAVD